MLPSLLPVAQGAEWDAVRTGEGLLGLAQALAQLLYIDELRQAPGIVGRQRLSVRVRERAGTDLRVRQCIDLRPVGPGVRERVAWITAYLHNTTTLHASRPF